MDTEHGQKRRGTPITRQGLTRQGLTRQGLTRQGLTRRGGIGVGATTGAALALAACGSASGSAKPPVGAAASGEVSVLYYVSNETVNTRMQRQQAAISTALPNVKLNMIPAPNKLVDKLQAMSVGGTPPDLTWAGIEVMQEVAAGLLQPLDELTSRDSSFPIKDFYPQAVAGYQYKGKLWGVPYGITTQGMAYNKALLDKNGVKYPTKDWTIADYISMAKRLVSPPGADQQVWGGWITHLYTAIWMHGGQIYDRAYTKSVVDQPSAMAGYQFYYDQGFGSQRYAPISDPAMRAGVNPLFGTGALAIANISPSEVPVLREKYPSLQWDVVTMPWNADKARGTWLSGEGFAMSSGTKNKDAAWAVLKQLSGRDSQLNFYVPELTTIPASRSVAESAFANAIPGKQIKAFVDSIEFATLWGGHPVIKVTDGPVQDVWNDVREGRKSVRDGAAETTQKLNDLLKQTPT